MSEELKRESALFRPLTSATMELHSSRVEDYFINFRVPESAVHFDENGIPMTVQAGGYGPLYNWTVVAQEALRRYQYWLDHPINGRRRDFLLVADAMVASQENLSACGTGWYHRFPVPMLYDSAAPRTSGMIQGLAISVLVRAHAATGDDRYITLADRAFDLLVASHLEGGTRFETPGGNWWYEERPREIPPFTLNGAVYALFGIVDIYRVRRQEKHKMALERGVAGLRELLPRFEYHGWTLYHLQPFLIVATDRYHLAHARQMQALGMVVRDRLFLDYGNRWEAWYFDIEHRKTIKWRRTLNHHLLDLKREGFARFTIGRLNWIGSIALESIGLRKKT